MKIELSHISNASSANASEEKTGISLSWLTLNRNQKKLPLKIRQRFYADLFLLLQSGLDLRYSLQLISEEEKKQKVKDKFDALSKQVVLGKSLSEALRAVADIQEFEYFSLKIGEETGRINEVLKQLADYYDSKIQQRRQIISALSYPMIVMVTAIGAVVFMLQVVVPLFQDVFMRFGKELPQLTQGVIAASDTLGRYSPILLIVILTLILLFPLIRKSAFYPRASAWIIQRIPIFGKVITKMYLLQLVSSLELMLSSNTNLVKAVELAHQMTPFHPLKVALESIKQDLVNGESLSKGMGRFSVFDSRFITLIKVGEEVNQLPETLSKLRIQYEKDIDVFSKSVGSILEPAIILFIGGFVGTIIISMYLPMFELSSLF